MWFWLWLTARQRVEVPLGWVADFCPLCRFVKPFRLVRVAEVGTTSEVQALVRRCTVCAVDLPYDPGRYRAVVSVPTSDLGALIAETFPDLQQVLAPRLALEQRVREAPASLSRAERADLIREPLALVAPYALESPGNEDARMAWVTAVAAVLLSGTIGQLAGMGGALGSLFSALSLATLIGGIGVASTRPERGRQQRLAERAQALVGALRPLQPSAGELQQALASLPGAHGRLARSINPVLLERAIAAPSWPSGLLAAPGATAAAPTGHPPEAPAGAPGPAGPAPIGAPEDLAGARGPAA